MKRLYDSRDDSEKTRDALNSNMKNKIKELIGKCESCNRRKPVNLIEVHHISEVASANGKSDKNTPGNLIVLCRDHHKLAHDGEISTIVLKGKVAKRSDTKKSELRKILRSREKVTSDMGSPYKPYKPPKIKLPKIKTIKINIPTSKSPKF